MTRYWYLRDLEGGFNDTCFLYRGEKAPVMDDDGEWREADDYDGGYFWESDDIRQMFGDIELPKLEKGERIEMVLTLDVK